MIDPNFDTISLTAGAPPPPRTDADASLRMRISSAPHATPTWPPRWGPPHRRRRLGIGFVPASYTNGRAWCKPCAVCRLSGLLRVFASSWLHLRSAGLRCTEQQAVFGCDVGRNGLGPDAIALLLEAHGPHEIDGDGGINPPGELGDIAG